MKDILEAMLAAQADVQKTLGNDIPNMPDVDRMRYMTEMAWSACDEIHEAMGEVGWKSWATSNHINREEFMGEMTDAWLFFMNLMMAGGMTAEDLIERTSKKQDNTLMRFATGYDGRSTKCPRCKRAYDNEGVKCKPGAVGELGQCAYVSTPAAPIVVDPETQCIVCGYHYGDTHCAPASDQGFGWCHTRSKTFTADGSIVGA